MELGTKREIALYLFVGAIFLLFNGSAVLAYAARQDGHEGAWKQWAMGVSAWPNATISALGHSLGIAEPPSTRTELRPAPKSVPSRTGRKRRKIIQQPAMIPTQVAVPPEQLQHEYQLAILNTLLKLCFKGVWIYLGLVFVVALVRWRPVMPGS